VVWGGGLLVYILAVANRSSFGVAGLSAAERFGVSATVLSLFVVVQLGVYAIMQLPAGMALDRFGPRILLVIGGLMMAVGQFTMALAPALNWAFVARVLIGAGDATIFVSAVRLVWDWFPSHRRALLMQLTGVAGNLGQIITAFPFALALERAGWTSSFSTLAAATATAALVAAIIVKSAPVVSTESGAVVSRRRRGGSSTDGVSRGTVVSFAPTDGEHQIPAVEEPVFAGVSKPRKAPESSFLAAIRHPATWLGFFAHMLGGLSSTIFVMMWGVPFMRQGGGYTEDAASLVLLIVVLTVVLSAPLIGRFTAKNPHLRTAAAFYIGGLVTIGWLIMLLPTAPIPYWLFVFAVILIAIGGPASLIGLDLAGSFNHPDRRSTVQGISNMGGFVAAIAVMLGVGAILDNRTAGNTPVLADYRAALSIVFIPIILSALGILHFRNKTKQTLKTYSPNF